MDQPTILLITIAVVAILVVAIGAYAVSQRRRQHLREHFGPEYQRLLSEQGDRGRAERILSQREERVKKLDIRPLPDTAREQFLQGWRKVQTRFVDDPRGAVGDADDLIGQAMEARGYPVGDFEQRAADVSVEHPQLVIDYRTAHEIARRQKDVTTEDLRQAMVRYRSLFAELVGEAPATEESAEEREEMKR
jgi:hypothetical protein